MVASDLGNENIVILLVILSTLFFLYSKSLLTKLTPLIAAKEKGRRHCSGAVGSIARLFLTTLDSQSLSTRDGYRGCSRSVERNEMCFARLVPHIGLCCVLGL